ncbi:MAG: hypothetical protein AAGH78_00610 [Cyanobacteria bacterium P01_H01_bin.58]
MERLSVMIANKPEPDNTGLLKLVFHLAQKERNSVIIFALFLAFLATKEGQIHPSCPKELHQLEHHIILQGSDVEEISKDSQLETIFP